MKQRLLLSVCCILLLTLTVIVSAEISQTSGGNYNVKVYLEKGWNLVYGVPLLQEGYPLQEGSTLNKEDIKAIFWYNPKKLLLYLLYSVCFLPEEDSLPEVVGHHTLNSILSQDTLSHCNSLRKFEKFRQ